VIVNGDSCDDGISVSHLKHRLQNVVVKVRKLNNHLYTTPGIGVTARYMQNIQLAGRGNLLSEAPL